MSRVFCQSSIVLLGQREGFIPDSRHRSEVNFCYQRWRPVTMSAELTATLCEEE